MGRFCVTTRQAAAIYLRWRECTDVGIGLSGVSNLFSGEALREKMRFIFYKHLDDYQLGEIDDI